MIPDDQDPINMLNKSSNSISETSPSTCAVVVTHYPTEILIELLYRLRNQVTHTIIVDNASPKTNQALLEARDFSEVTLISNYENLGIGHALNQGMEVAIQKGYAWVVTFDQDSYPEVNMVMELHRALSSAVDANSIAMIAPQIIDINYGRVSRFLMRGLPFSYRRLKCEQVLFQTVTYAITSGAMVNTEIYQELRGFREEFFMDFIDIEFCLRAQIKGYKILAVCSAKLLHSFGNRRVVTLGPITLHPSFHSPERWYTISRNRIQMIKSFGLRLPHWLSYEFVATVFTTSRMLLTEDRRKSKCLAMIRGTWDGCRDKLGTPEWANKSIGNSV
jgi:rhamnosyltransferase